MTRDETIQTRSKRRGLLFTELVTQALENSELDDFVGSPSGLSSDYLRQRFARESERLWDEVAERAAVFDTLADRYDEMQLWSAPLRLLNRVSTSDRVPRLTALLGLAVVLLSYLWYTPGPADLFPYLPLLWAAFGVNVAVMVMSMMPVAPRLASRSLFDLPPEDAALRIARRGGPALTVLLFVASIVVVRAANATHPPLAVQWSFLLPFLIGLVAIALPLARATPHPARGLFDWLAGAAVVAGGLLPVLSVAVRSDGGIKRLASPLPDLTVATPGLVLLLSAAFLTCAGLLTTPADRVTAAYQQAERDLRDHLLTRAMMPFLREELNRHRPSFATTMSVTEAPGLSEVPDPMYRVHTPAAQQVAALIERMPGGSIGLAGPRGCGKTTTIESYCAAHADAATLSVVVSAPVEYTARDFLLHLYAKVCLRVAGPDSAAAFGRDPMGEAARRRQLRSLGVYTAILVTGGVLVTFGGGIELVNTTTLWGIGMLMAALFVMTYLGFHLRGGPLSGPRVGDPPLAQIAADRLDEIRYQQTFTSTWTGTLKPPLGIEAALGGGRTLVRQPMQLPEIVDSLRDFLGQVAQDRGKVLIGIDELDKMRSDQAAEQFLNEIKSIFGVRRCYYLVSVSEDAMSGFERRGLPFRDVFDSTFDEIVWFSHLGLDEAEAAINRRVVGMPVPFTQFCFALSGGLPRDLVRSARAVLGAQDTGRDTDLSTIAARLVGQDVARKTRAIAVASRKLAAEPALSRFLLACAGVTGDQSPAALHTRISGLVPLIEATGVDGDEGALRQLIAELAAYYYYSATLLEFFTSDAPEDRWRAPETVRGSDAAHLASLAEARQAFSVNVRVAWETVSAFRKAWGLSVDEFPEQAAKRARSSFWAGPRGQN